MKKKQNNPFESLVFLTNRVGRLLSLHIQKRISPEMKMTHPQHIGVLVDLWQKDGVRQQDLAISTIKDKATIARALDAMERQNLVVRVIDPNDKRNKRIYLTHKGREMKNTLLPIADAVTHEASEDISEDEMVICRKVLEKMYLNLHPGEKKTVQI